MDHCLVTIVDYGMGNVHSISKVLGRAGVPSIVSASAEQIATSQKLILPGVGHFGRAMANLRERGLVDALNEAVQVRKVPILGICLGMQLMARHSAEGAQEGLGWFDGSVVRFTVEDSLRYKVPHIGWNQAVPMKSSALLNGVEPVPEFYFLHSFHYVTAETEDVLMQTTYSYSFASAIERDNVYGVQFHPEKSQEVGARLLKNFVAL